MIQVMSCKLFPKKSQRNYSNLNVSIDPLMIPGINKINFFRPKPGTISRFDYHIKVHICANENNLGSNLNKIQIVRFSFRTRVAFSHKKTLRFNGSLVVNR